MSHHSAFVSLLAFVTAAPAWADDALVVAKSGKYDEAVAAAEDAGGTINLEIEEVDAFSVDIDEDGLDAKARKFMAEHKDASYEEALVAVGGKVALAVAVACKVAVAVATVSGAGVGGVGVAGGLLQADPTSVEAAPANVRRTNWRRVSSFDRLVT